MIFCKNIFNDLFKNFVCNFYDFGFSLFRGVYNRVREIFIKEYNQQFDIVVDIVIWLFYISFVKRILRKKKEVREKGQSDFCVLLKRNIVVVKQWWQEREQLEFRGVFSVIVCLLIFY